MAGDLRRDSDGQRQPVLVVGAGPVGLVAALALRAADLPVVVLEAEADGRERPGSRAIYLHGESLRHLETLSPGLGQELARQGLVWTTKKTYWREHLVYERTYPPPDPRVLPHSTNLSQVAIEAMLLEACGEAGVTIVWGAEVAGVEVGSDGVVVRTADGRCRPAEYVIGADGARSAVRRAAGIELEGPRSEDTFVIVDVAEDADSPMLPERVFHYEHPAVDGRNVLLVPFAGGIRADLQLRPGDDADRLSRPEGVRQWIARVLPSKYADRVTWVSTYRFHQVVAGAFTDPQRRILLVGEAAHLFAPFGARGLNSGIPDAILAARAIGRALADPVRASSAVDHFAAVRRGAALYNRDASSLALAHMQANGRRIRWERRIKAFVARRGMAAGAWLDSSPFGPKAAEHQTETGSY